MARLERPPPKSVFSGPPLDLQIVEVGQQIFGALGAQITAERESAYRGRDFEVNQGWSVQLMPGEVSPGSSASQLRSSTVGSRENSLGTNVC